MLNRKFRWAAVLIGVSLPLTLYAADQAGDQAQRPQAQAKAKAQRQQQIYGSQLMTPEERTAYRTRMRGAKTQAERDQIRAEHHAAMQARAKEKGVTLPDQPRAGGGRRGGAGKGAGAGGGPGPGNAASGAANR
jgi:hypothetical protein